MALRISMPQLAWSFLRVGSLAFGGLGATLALVERDLVDRRGAVSRDQISQALTYTKLLPGSTVVQVVAYLGWQMRGWPGSAIGATCFLLPSTVLMLALAYGYAQIASLSGVAGVRRGVLAVVVALLLGTIFRLSSEVIKTPLARVLALGAFCFAALFPTTSTWIVVAAGLVGVIVYRDSR